MYADRIRSVAEIVNGPIVVQRFSQDCGVWSSESEDEGMREHALLWRWNTKKHQKTLLKRWNEQHNGRMKN
jgi:hypothetical protein